MSIPNSNTQKLIENRGTMKRYQNKGVQVARKITSYRWLMRHLEMCSCNRDDDSNKREMRNRFLLQRHHCVCARRQRLRYSQDSRFRCGVSDFPLISHSLGRLHGEHEMLWRLCFASVSTSVVKVSCNVLLICHRCLIYCN